MSSDHEIKNIKKFTDVIKTGIEYSNANKIVTFGVVPHSPETGYGYIKANKAFDFDLIQGHQIAEFIEKPNLKKACEFVKDKHYTR